MTTKFLEREFDPGFIFGIDGNKERIYTESESKKPISESLVSPLISIPPNIHLLCHGYVYVIAQEMLL